MAELRLGAWRKERKARKLARLAAIPISNHDWRVEERFDSRGRPYGVMVWPDGRPIGMPPKALADSQEQR